MDALGRGNRAVIARSRVDSDAAGDRLLVHAAPPQLAVTVRDQDGRVVAEGART